MHPPDDEKANANGHAPICIGQEYIRTELVLERAKAKVVKHCRKAYAGRELERETGYAEVLLTQGTIHADETVMQVHKEKGNNQIENAIRPFAVGRKGWLFADTPQEAKASAIISSLMETAKANHLRLDDDLLHLLSILPKRSKNFEIDDLLP